MNIKEASITSRNILLQDIPQRQVFWGSIRGTSSLWLKLQTYNDDMMYFVNLCSDTLYRENSIVNKVYDYRPVNAFIDFKD